MRVHFREAIDHPAFSITLLDESHRPVFTTNTDTQHIDTGAFDAGSDATIRLRFENFLAPGRYLLVASVARPGFGAEVCTPT